MTLFRLRRDLHTRPRLILAVLLAFAIEALPMTASVVSHRHDGGGLAHTHGGPIGAPSKRVGAAIAAAARDAGLHRVPSRDLHRHDAQPLLAMHEVSPVRLVPSSFTTDGPTAPGSFECPALLGTAQARAPPVLSA